jgi:hypothetical protein
VIGCSDIPREARPTRADAEAQVETMATPAVPGAP